MLKPVPAGVPPQVPVYHCHLAPLPKLPPVTARVFDVPVHELLLVTDTPVGAVDLVLMLTANDRAALIPQLFSAVTLMSPFCAFSPIFAIIILDPAPDWIVHPEGRLQL